MLLGGREDVEDAAAHGELAAPGADAGGGGVYSRSLVTAYVRAKHSVPTEDDVYDGGHAARVLGSVEAKALRASLIETIAATDYSRLDTPAVQTLSGAQSGFSANLRAT